MIKDMKETEKVESAEDVIRFQIRENRAALVCGVLAIGFALFIFVMWMLHPSGKGGGALLYLPLLCMVAGGAFCFLLYFHVRLTVEDRDICYVNLLGKEKLFTLDQIGFCKIGVGGSKNALVVYDLLGKKLCKLGIDMRGLSELHQYLLDNGIRVEWCRERLDSRTALLIGAIQQESAVCEEEIRKCAESFYEETEPIFREWEKRNQRFQAHWEIGFAEYLAEDVEQKCRSWERDSSVEMSLTTIPISYQCLLEAYLKCDEEYVVNSRGDVVSIILPYLVRCRSYQVGEGTRIRKSHEQSLQEWLELRLEELAKELPRHKYHTELLTLHHPLKKTAGIAEE